MCRNTTRNSRVLTSDLDVFTCISTQYITIPISLMLRVQFNKMSHNCAGWSVLGVVGEEVDLTMDYVREQALNTGYLFRPSDRWGD